MGHFMKFGYAKVLFEHSGLRCPGRGTEGRWLRADLQREGLRQVDQWKAEFAKLMKALKHGDVVTVVKLDAWLA